MRRGRMVGAVVAALGVALALACAGPLGDVLGPTTALVIVVALVMIVGGWVAATDLRPPECRRRPYDDERVS